jgi:hypothetical protein
MLLAVDRLGTKVLLRQPLVMQDAGGVNLPSGKTLWTEVPHLPHAKSICHTRGLMPLTRMTVPCIRTSFPGRTTD